MKETKTIQEHYDIIKQKINDLKTSVDECLLDTGLYPQLEITFYTSHEVKDSKYYTKQEHPVINFDTFKMIGEIIDDDSKSKKAKEIVERDDKKTLRSD